MLARERRPMPAFVDPAPGILTRFDALQDARREMPAPAPLPSLRDALQRRAAAFGPFEVDPALAAPRRAWRALGDLARRVVAALIS